MEAVKRENALRSGNSGKASAKKESAVIVSRRKASVKELVGMFVSAFGMTLFFGRWDDPVVQVTVLTVAVVLTVGGVVVALGGKE